MAHRVVEGLLWAKQIPDRPASLPVIRRVRGAKAKGRAYEKALGKALPSQFLHGPWFQFMDRNGLGHCQPDFIVKLRDRLLVLEVKYSWVPEGHSQIERLYQPVLERIFGLPVLGVVVCKRLRPEMGHSQVFGGLREAIASQAAVRVLHWLGAGDVGLGLRPPERVSDHGPLDTASGHI